MRRYLKITAITLSSLLLLLLVSFAITMWLLLSPERLTPIVRKQSEKYIPYQTEIGKVDLTLFSTFPRFGIRLNNLSIISPVAGAVSDTLLKLDELTGVIDIQKYRKDRQLFINELILSGGSFNIFADSLGASNYGLFLTEDSIANEEPSDTGFNFINLENIELNNLNFSYTDLANGINAVVDDLKAGMSGNLKDDKVSTIISVKNARVSFESEGEKYLEKARFEFRIPAEISLSDQWIEMKEAFLSMNGLGVILSGSVENDLLNENIFADINYEFNSLKIEDIVGLVPRKYLSGTGVSEVSGIISSKGHIKGMLNDSVIPEMDINLHLNDGNICYKELPFPLSEMSGDIRFYTDKKAIEKSGVLINHLKAKTPGSVIETNGKVLNVFGDMQCNLSTRADILLEEFREFVPDDLKIQFNGRVKGQVNSDFLLSELTAMNLDKINVNGSALLSGFEMIYDSLSVFTNHSKIDFSLPNKNALKENTGFASARLESDNFYASETGTFNVSLKESNIYLEMSDVRDTTRIPDLFCIYRSDSLKAKMDTIDVGMVKTYGNISVFPAEDDPVKPGVELAYSTYGFSAKAGENEIDIDDILLKTTIINDPEQEDIFLRWLTEGSLDMQNGNIRISSLSEPLMIPSVKMDFNPETFNIHDGRMNIDKSDYQLKGTVRNILSWFKDDSILRADFDFYSHSTDIGQLMYLTSGIGEEEEEENYNSSLSEEDSFSGPYMVPRGVDLNLNARVDHLISGYDTAVNIRGNVKIKDGVLVLEDLNFTTPAADMQLTAMYRTPRKNHLYLGLDYHMLDVEISRLLQMIPDIDTLMPMLRSFDGSGEFHIAAETYLDSAYNIKKSTLRGASSLSGEDLVLMDGETFSEIAKKLHFSRKAENRVDSLSAEFTIFREEVDIYPFLIVMDRYKAVVGGRHNFDMSFDYHISLVDSPLPVRLGIDIHGNEEDLKYRVSSPRYAELYRPVSRKVVENRQLELRQLIRETLIQKVEDRESTEVLNSQE